MFRKLPAIRVPLLAALLSLGGVPSLAAAAGPPAYLLQWGSSGSGNGQFSAPSGVALDAGGNVYVADTGNHRIQKFTSAGTYVSQWGGFGSGNGQFSSPNGIAIAGGNVYVVDTGNQRVQVFTTSGAYVSQWGTAGSGNGQFVQPLCVAVDGGGDVYVTDGSLNRVQKFTGAGAYLTQWGTTGGNSGEFNPASGIAVDGWGVVNVTDLGLHRIEQFGSGGAFLAQWGGFGTIPGAFDTPRGIATDGANLYVVDTSNNRVQFLSHVGYYVTEWGTAGTGNGQFTNPRAAATDGSVVYVADTGANRIQKFGFAPTEECPTCPTQPDPCCSALPTVGGPWSNILVSTHEPHFFLPNPYAVTIYDLNASPLPVEDTDWASMTRYHGPANSWTGDSLGSVFGLTLDEYGNIFVTHTSCYSGDMLGQVFGGGAGAVYRIDAATGKITTFCKLPNFQDTARPNPENWPGLGNITYDCNHKQFFVTNLEDGKIYRIKPVGVNGATGTVVETFDPLAPDNGLPGWAPLGQRLWGVQWHADRVYYGVWAQNAMQGASPNEIRSVALLPAGGFSTSSDQHELFLPVIQGQNWSNPVADISFSADGKMLLGERGIQDDTYPFAHASRALEYACTNGCWVPANHYLVGAYFAGENAEGGVDYDPQPFGGPTSAIGRVWVSGDALHLGPPYTDIVYGYQGLRPNLLFGSNVTSMLIDADSFVQDQDKTYIGDVEVPGCVPAAYGSVCGHKFSDLNHNGVADGGEPGVAGWTLTLNGPGGPYTAITDASGAYCFTNLAPGAYTIGEANLPGWVQTAPAGGTFALNLAAGQTLTGYDFGNYACGGGVGGCVSPPPMMIAWWPFNESVGSTSAKDATHLVPARNVAQLYGGAAITGAGKVARALCFNSEGDWARVPISNQWGTNFGASPFAIDAWVKPLAGGGANRMIAEKRTLVGSSPYRIIGWALYLNGQQCFFELGNGVSTQVLPGPTIPAGSWTHLAVVVDRAPAAGRWYVDGALSPAFNFVPVAGSISNSADIWMGQVSPPFGVSTGFLGCIDELEILSTPTPPGSVLPAATVAAIYNAGAAGKCPETLLMPQVTTVCKDQATVQVCFNICNASASAQSYHWSASALPAGPGCTVAGPATFAPAGGSVVVPAGGCSAPICVTFPRPAGLTTHNATSCFSISFVNDSTGACQTRTGTVRADYSCWCMTPLQTGIVSVPGRLAPGIAGIPVVIGIKNPCPPAASPYRVFASSLDPDHEDPLAVSLNGLPPGEPVIGTLSVAPGEPEEQQLTVMVSFPDGYDPSAPYELVLEADTDGDGVMERQSGTVIVSTYDGSETVSAGEAPGPAASVRLSLAPNPFLAGSSVEFSLARAEDVDLSVYDLGGRRVRLLQHGRLAAGAHRFAWDGRDDHGRRAPAGVYFVRLGAAGRSMESKLVKLQ